MGLYGKTALITGGGGGIGLAIAKAFASEGATRLILLGRTVTKLQDAQKNILSANSGVEVRFLEASIARKELWQEIAGEISDVDILVNAAGITHSSLLVAMPTDAIENIYRTNLLGTTFACQSVIKNFLRQKRHGVRTRDNPGTIINVSSLFGIKGGRGSAAYAASKAGIIALTRSLAAEYGSQHINVNTIVPGYITTSMTDAMGDKARKEALESIPNQRFGTQEEVAHAALFLATNRYANNTVLNLDGGLSAT